MVVDIGLIFTAAGVAKSVAEFAGLLDSIESKVDRLVQSELNAGLRALEQAGQSTMEQVPLLREARSCFNKATSLEIGYRRVVALLGLSVCHHCLGDEQNCSQALDEILAIDPVSMSGLVAAGGVETIRDFNPLKMYSVVIKSMTQQMSSRNTWEDRRKALDIVAQNHPVAKYGRLLFSRSARREAHKRLVLDAVSRNADASAIRRVQEAVSMHVGKPVCWLHALD